MNRPGRILTETIYGSWCDLCDEHLGDFTSYQGASIALTAHLDMKHLGWEGKIPPIAEKEKRGKQVKIPPSEIYVQEIQSGNLGNNTGSNNEA